MQSAAGENDEIMNVGGGGGGWCWKYAVKYRGVT